MVTSRPRRVVSRAAAAILALGVAGCENEAPRRTLRLTDPPPSPAATPTGLPAVLRVGIASTLSPSSSLPFYRELADYMGERLGLETEVLQRASYADMNELLRRRHCTVGFICAYAYIRAEREFGVVPIAVPRIAGTERYRAYVIVRREAPFRDWSDLAGTRFAFADPLCNAGWLYPAYRAAQLGRSTQQFFGSESYTYAYEKSIRAVADDLADAASVEAPLYDAMTAARDPAALATRVLERSPEFGTPPVVVHPAVDPELRGRIAEFFLSLHDTARGREILRGIGVERFVAPDPASWDGIRAMARDVEGP